ncbi:MAG: RagB/SusD family nutrient uptake outer membrane protein, partial [Prevotellaceae bacterium]|nr:RagB/SusD family nutrient uptake outer membrane protein [Prevotellaceae bacterium]
MKQKRYTFIIMGALVALTLLTNACVDQIKFGNAFLDKASGNSVTKDTVFASAAYTQQFLTGIYARQFYGLPYNNLGEGTTANSVDLYTGKNEAMTDICHDNWSSSNHYGVYYNGTLTANYGFRGVMFHYNDEFVWEAVRAALILIENIDDVPDLETSERNRMVAEAKCLIAARYYDMFRYYGGLPLLYESFTGSESSYDFPRATVEETVDYMINWLDEAIDSGAMPWAYDGSSTSASTTWLGRWTTAGAMALKCKILQFAASPL